MACLLAPLPSFAQTPQPVVIWPQPGAVNFPSAVSSVQLDAYALAGAPVSVPLGAYFNITGITSDGYKFAGGFDDSGWAYSDQTLQYPTYWQGIPFALGPTDAPDAVYGATIALPAGKFGKLMLLGDLVNNEVPPVAHFTVTYTDGTMQAYTQSMSDWVNPMNYPGESLVYCASTRHILDGSIDHNSVCIYGYQLTLDPTKTVQSLTLPNDRDVVLLSADLLPAAVQGTFTYSPSAGAVLQPGSNTLSTVFTPADPQTYSSAQASVSLLVNGPSTPITPTIAWPTPAPIVYGTPLTSVQLNASAVATDPATIPLGPVSRVDAFYPDGTLFLERGFDGTYTAFSATQLGTSLSYAGYSFPLGIPSVPDAASSSVISLPPGSYSSLYLIGAAGTQAETSQPFVITYSDGTKSTTSVSLSSWRSSQGFPGETVVATTPYALTSAAGQVAGTFDLYGYTIPVDPTRSVVSLTLPPNADVIIVAAGLGPSTPFVVGGNYVYNPPAGTYLPQGVDPLAVSFSPTDTVKFAPAKGTNSITVETPVLTITANNSTRVFGTANPVFTGSITGAIQNDTFIETFSTTAVPLSPAGNYAIVPAASGAHLSLYQQVINDGTLTVTRAPVTTSLTTAPAAVLQTQQSTLTATVASTTTGTPSGNVHFYGNNTLLGSAVLNNGTATLETLLPYGTTGVTFTYDGDQNFLPTASSSSAVTVTANDFLLTAPNGLSFSGILGQSPSVLLHVSPVHGVYAGNITLTSQGALPPFASGSFSPAMVPASDGGVDIQFSVATRLLNAENAGSKFDPTWAGCLLLLPLATLFRARKRLGAGLTVLLVLCGLGAMAGLSGCGSGYHAGGYPIVVTASDGTIQHSLTVTLQIQAQ